MLEFVEWALLPLTYGIDLLNVLLSIVTLVPIELLVLLVLAIVIFILRIVIL